MKSFAISMMYLLSALTLGACSTTPTNDHSDISNNKTDPRTVATVNANTADSSNDAKGILAKRSVYFDYDDYGVKHEFHAVIEAHSQYLAKNQDKKILIQGNTDERGGTEYNLALGQKRAEAVRKSLVLLGVPDRQMEAVSLGKEKPKALGSDEAAWTENRRADIIHR
jgi:peptidoglycan-associated lipoprotein